MERFKHYCYLLLVNISASVMQAEVGAIQFTPLLENSLTLLFYVYSTLYVWHLNSTPPPHPPQ